MIVMKRIHFIVIFALIIASFFAGFLYSRKSNNNHGGTGDRKILYYADPMNPGMKSDKPGLAPCGMQLEPVYADDARSGNSATLAPGTVLVNLEKQQLIGVRVATVENAPWSHTIRALGRVVPDETRVYRINAATDGWIKKITSATTDSLVEKDELLATFYAPEFFSALKAYLYGLRSYDRFKESGQETHGQLDLTDANVENYRNALRNLGMTEHQMDEIKRTRQGGNQVEIRAPAAGFILVRNITLGQRFDRGSELYRIADLSEVWIVADTYENEAYYLKPGMRVRVSAPNLKKTFFAWVAKVPPRFDPTSRTLQVRLEAHNPGLLLRSDMFVDVEIPIQLAPGISVPADAVLDSGRRQTVFVDLGKGFFEPRNVKTGWRFGGRVEITEGLSSGERIVVSGNFLIDSESRMKLAAAGLYGVLSQDPVCGTEVDESKAKPTGLTSEYGGKTYYFCSEACKKEFAKNPAAYIMDDKKSPPLPPAQEENIVKEQEDQPHTLSSQPSPSREIEPSDGDPAKAFKEKSESVETAQPMETKVADHSGSDHPGSSTKPETAKDPVCATQLTTETAAAKSEYLGKTYFFCSDECKMVFDRNPGRYIEKTDGSSSQAPQQTHRLRRRGNLQ